ncbi:ribosomal RNA-processing protein 8 [Lithobates pipiens]
MFDTGEWNDNLEAQTLTESLVSTQKRRSPDTPQEKGAISRRKRLKRNRQLLEILQTLKSPSTQIPDLPPPPEVVHSPRKQKKVTPGISATKSSTPESEAPSTDTGTQLSRKQWKNKLKNRKRNRNKFKPCPEKLKNMDSGKREEKVTDGAKSECHPLRDPGKDHGGKGKRLNKGRGGPESGSHVIVQPRGVNEVEDDTSLPGDSPTDKDEGKKVYRKEKMPRDHECDPGSPRMTPAEKARLEKLKKLLKKEFARGEREMAPVENPEDTTGANDPILPEGEGTDRSVTLRSRMEQRLHSARFRYINEQLYTSESQEAVHLFQGDPEAFTIYHTGFSQQVQRWPVNPITEIIKYVKNRPPLLVVADFGCGDAQLARSVRNKVHSFDLVALNDLVTVCDIAQVPLSDGIVDIAVFCLSLMGKNLNDFLREANRVLKMEGVLLVAEVSSRFDDVRQFLSAISQLGFKCVNKNTDNSHFYLFEFSKIRLARDASKHPGLQLKPCLYKKR